MNRFEKLYFRGGLKVPDALPAKAAFRASPRFEAPSELLLDGYCTPVEDQGTKPWCAAYSASSFAENVLWRVKGYRTEIDPEPVYRYAKTVDGDPDGDGTYLGCALRGVLAGGWLDGSVCKVKTFGSSGFGLGEGDGLNELKYAVHKYGCCVAGFQITSDWFSPRDGVVEDAGGRVEGGHAVTVCGYDEGGVLLLNSWGREWGHDGFAYLPNSLFRKQFMYGAVLTRCLDGIS